MALNTAGLQANIQALIKALVGYAQQNPPVKLTTNQAAQQFAGDDTASPPITGLADYLSQWLPQASSVADGYLAATDWTRFNGGGTVVASPGTLNVQSYGATGDGTTDDTAAIQAAVTAAVSDHAILFFPAGTYKMTSAIALSGVNGLIVRGVGAASVLHATGYNGQHFTFSDCSAIHIEDLSFTGDGINAPNSVGGLYFEIVNNDNNPYHVFRNLNFTGITADGIAISTPIMTVFSNVTVMDVEVNGFNLWNGTSVTMESCYGITAGECGFLLTNMTYCTLSACASESSGIGFSFVNSKAIAMLGCGVEATVDRSPSYPGYGFQVNGGDVTAIACYARACVAAQTNVIAPGVLDTIGYWDGDTGAASTSLAGVASEGDGDWTPVFTGMTVSGGTATTSGHWDQEGSVRRVNVTITPPAGGTITSTAGTTYCPLPIGMTAARPNRVEAYDATTGISIGPAYLGLGRSGNAGNMFLPDFGPIGGPVTILGSLEVL